MRKNTLSACLVLGLVAAGRAASATVCLDQETSLADQALWDLHGCDTTFAAFDRDVFDVRFADDALACTLPYEYPKHWNAAWLMAYGLSDNYDQQWHSAQDYLSASVSHSPQYHDDFYHQVVLNDSIYGRWSRRDGEDELDLSCTLFDPHNAAGTRTSHANPASRGGDFVHEAFHGWLYHNGYQPGHLANPADGNCQTPGKSCDYFYFHGVGLFDFGTLWFQNGTADYFHSPNQTQVEYLCDVAILPQPWVPSIVPQVAQKDAEARSKKRFINGPAFKCGDPRPW